MDPNTYPKSIKDLMSKYPDGNEPELSFTPRKVPASDVSMIHFYATGPEDLTGNGDQGCHGGGSQGEISIPRSDFAGAKLCPSGNGGDGGNDDLEDNGASFTLSGNLGNCQLNFYSQLGCKDADWAGYMSGASQRKTCNVPVTSKGELLKGFRSFNYICPDV